MQLNAILHSIGELLNGSGERPAEGNGEAGGDALLPFAAVLSGTLSLLTPQQETPVEGAGQHPVPQETAGASEASGAQVQPLNLGVLDLANLTGHPVEPTAAATPLPAVDEAQQGARLENTPKPVVMDQRQGSEAVLAADLTGKAPGADTLEAAQQTFIDANTPTSSTIKKAGQTPSLSEAHAVSSAAPVTDASSEVAGRIVQIDDQTSLDATAGETSNVSEREDAASGRRLRAAKPLGVGEKAPPAQQAAEPTTHPLALDAEVTQASEGDKAQAAGAASELDVTLPDLEGVRLEKEAEASAKTEAKTTAMNAEDGEVAADAGGDSEAKDDGTGRSSRARRAEAEPAALRQRETFTVDGGPSQNGAATEVAAAQDVTPEEAETPNPATPDLDPSLASAEEHVTLAATDKTTSETPTSRARAARGLFQQNRAVPVAWLRAVLNNARQATFSEDGWKVLEMNLDEGDGTVTIKARREEGRVAVAVGFSDPELRALANAHADRLQEALQAEYETTVDFSLFSGNTGDSGAQQHAESGRAAVAVHTDADADARRDRPAHRALPAGAQHEWVG